MWLQPLRNIDKSPQGAIEEALTKVIEKAEKKFDQTNENEYPKGGIGVSTLRPYHVEDSTPTLPDAGINNWRTTISTAQTWEDWFNLTTNEQLYILCTGMFNRTLSPSLTEVKFNAAGRESCVQNIEQIYTWQEPSCFWSKPFDIEPQKPFQGRLYGRVAQQELMGLLGFCVAETAILITET